MKRSSQKQGPNRKNGWSLLITKAQRCRVSHNEAAAFLFFTFPSKTHCSKSALILLHALLASELLLGLLFLGLGVVGVRLRDNLLLLRQDDLDVARARHVS